MKRLLPFTLIVLGTLALSGCLFIPTFNPVISGKNVAGDVGGAKSSRPLRVGQATVQQVVAVLGKPPYSSDDGRRIAYVWTVRNGYWIFPFWFGWLTVKEQPGHRALELAFDSNDVLQAYQVNRVDENIMLEYGGPYPPPLSPDLRARLTSGNLQSPATVPSPPSTKETKP